MGEFTDANAQRNEFITGNLYVHVCVVEEWGGGL